MNLFYILNTNTKMLLYSKPDSCWNLSIQNHDVCNYHSDLKIKINIGSERLRVPFLLGISPTWNVWFSVLRHLCVGFFFSPTHQEMCEERRPSYVAPKSCILLIHGWWQWMGAGISPPLPPDNLFASARSRSLSPTPTKMTLSIQKKGILWCCCPSTLPPLERMRNGNVASPPLSSSIPSPHSMVNSIAANLPLPPPHHFSPTVATGQEARRVWSSPPPPPGKRMTRGHPTSALSQSVLLLSQSSISHHIAMDVGSVVNFRGYPTL